MRDRLIELVDKAKDEYANDVTDHTETEYIVEGLLNHGVIVPPCKVGQTVWFIRSCTRKNEITETKVEKVVLKRGGLYLKLGCNSMYETSCNSIGKTVFFTKEEAERALKGGEE